MKAKMVKYLLINIVTASILSACKPYEGVQIYEIGKAYSFGDSLSIKLVCDFETEDFIATYDSKSYENIYFSFQLYERGNIANSYGNDVLVFTDKNGNNLAFDSKNEYVFSGNNVITISYKNVNETFKNLIRNRKIAVEMSSATWELL